MDPNTPQLSVLIPPPPDPPFGQVPPRPPVRVPGFHDLRPIGSGGMGLVYAATQTALNRTVAVKFLRPELCWRPDALARFRAEAAVVARLQHPNIVQVYEAGEADGRPFLAMELVPGGSLADRLARDPLPPRPAAELVRAVAEAVHTAHQAGIIHRDLKPANILMSGVGSRESGVGFETTPDSRLPTPAPKVADFGMAKTLAGAAADTPTDGLTESGTVVGTPGYMAPEQAGGHAAEVGPAADVYALGAILYATLTGRPPFQAASLLDTLELVRSADPVPIRRLVPAVPRDLETICLKCLRKTPAQRYPTAQAVADDLGRFLDGAPITARPVGSVERAAKWCRRRPAWAALIAVGILVPTVGVAAVVEHNTRLRAALAEKTAEEEKARREKERADENYRNARQALRRTLDALADKRFADLPRVTELRKAQAEAALAFYRTVADRTDDASPEVRHDAARADFETGQLYYALGDGAQAAVHYRRAVSGLDRLIAEHPDRREYRSDRGLALLNLGSLAGTPTEAAAVVSRGVDDLRPLADGPAANYADKSHLANALNSLGLIHRAAGRPADAEPLLKAALDLRTALGAGHETDPTYNRLLAENMINLGSIYRETGRTELAADLHDKCEAVLQRLVDADPTDRQAAASLAVERVNWAYVLIGQKRHADALDRLARSLPPLDRLNQLDPDDARVRDALYRVHGMRSQLFDDLERFPEAVASGEMMMRFCPPDGRRVGGWLLARRRALAGDPAGALRDVERLLPDTPAAAELGHGTETAALAAAHRRAAGAVCSGAAADGADRADAVVMTLLAKVKAVAPAADWARLVAEVRAAPLFHPYRGRPAFDKLVAGK